MLGAPLASLMVPVKVTGFASVAEVELGLIVVVEGE